MAITPFIVGGGGTDEYGGMVLYVNITVLMKLE
jgi:hypothetical protein